MPPKEREEESEVERHARKMAKKKAVRDRIMADKSGDKGLLIVHTGKGKGKTTAALGMAIRCLGHGMKVGMVQFIKGAMETAERRVLEGLGAEVKAMGEGFTWETQDRERDEAAAIRAWEEAARMLADPSYNMVILDELNVVLRYGTLPLDDVVAALTARPTGQHAVVTGRGAPSELIEAAELVTEMAQIKHPFRDGIKGQAGVEF